MSKALPLAVAALVLLAGAAHAASTYTVQPVDDDDEKAVFATVESLNVVPARVTHRRHHCQPPGPPGRPGHARPGCGGGRR